MQRTPFRMKIHPGPPSISVKIGYENITKVAIIQLIKVPYGRMLGLTASAMYSHGIGPKVDEKVPRKITTAIPIIKDDLSSPNKKLIPMTKRQMEMMHAPTWSKMTLPYLLMRMRLKKTQQSPMECTMME
jgi:hypothetical protein